MWLQLLVAFSMFKWSPAGLQKTALRTKMEFVLHGEQGKQEKKRKMTWTVCSRWTQLDHWKRQNQKQSCEVDGRKNEKDPVWACLPYKWPSLITLLRLVRFMIQGFLLKRNYLWSAESFFMASFADILKHFEFLNVRYLFFTPWLSKQMESLKGSA